MRLITKVITPFLPLFNMNEHTQTKKLISSILLIVFTFLFALEY